MKRPDKDNPFALSDQDREILLMKGKFIVINSITNPLSHSEPYPTQATIIREVQCPSCGIRFTQSGTVGCFGSIITPLSCDCGFPQKQNDSRLSDKKRTKSK